MHSHVRPFWIALLALGGVYANAAGQDAQTTAHMVYTEEQATRGEDVFWNISVSYTHLTLPTIYSV